MKKILFIAVLMLASSAIYAQASTAKMTNETITSLKPEDGHPVMFSSQEELDNNLPLKIEGIRKEILNANDPEQVKMLREKLWRYENAKVAEPRN